MTLAASAMGSLEGVKGKVSCIASRQRLDDREVSSSSHLISFLPAFFFSKRYGQEMQQQNQRIPYLSITSSRELKSNRV